MSPLNQEDRDAFIQAVKEVAESTHGRQPTGDEERKTEYDLDGAETEYVRNPEEVRARIAVIDAQQRGRAVTVSGFLKITLKKMLKVLVLPYPRSLWPW